MHHSLAERIAHERTPPVFGYRVLDRFSPVKMGLKSTELSGSYDGSQVAPYQIVDCGGPIARSGEGQPAGWHGLQAGRAGAYGRRPPLGTPPRASPRRGRLELRRSSSGGSAANGARGRTDNANCGERLVGVPFGPMTKPHGSWPRTVAAGSA